HHLPVNDLTINQVAPQLIGPGNAQHRRPFPQFTNVSLVNPSIGNSSYHAGFVRARRRFGQRLSFVAHYTFSKFLDDVETANDICGKASSYMDANRSNMDKALSAYDVPHRMTGTLSYDFPSFHGRRYLNRSLGGWKLAIIQTVESGPTFTVIAA